MGVENTMGTVEHKMSVKVEINDWKKLDNEQIKIVKLTSASGFQVELLSLGATIYSAKYPGDQLDVILGFDDPSGYDGTGNPFFWGTTGRLTNRVKNGKFSIDGVEYQLSKNDFGNDHRHHLHGGNKSFDRLNWHTSLAEEGDGVVFSILSPHGSEGYPGNLIASVKYSLKEECHLDIEMCAATDRATVVNISNHVYFNLAGHDSGWEGMNSCSLQLLEAESTSHSDLCIVLECRASHRRSQKSSSRSGSEFECSLLSCDTSRLLTSGLIEPCFDTVLPILLEVCVG